MHVRINKENEKMNIFSKEYREAKKNKKAIWKEYKKNKKLEKKIGRKLQRESLKEEYAEAPMLTKFFHVYAYEIKKMQQLKQKKKH